MPGPGRSRHGTALEDLENSISPYLCRFLDVSSLGRLGLHQSQAAVHSGAAAVRSLAAAAEAQLATAG